MKLDCIYFLFDDTKIVYIGQTRNLKWRIPNHFDKAWTHIRWIPCERAKMFYWEKRLIRYFKPKYNKQFLPTDVEIKQSQTYKLDKELLNNLKKEAKTVKRSFNNYVEVLLSTHPHRKNLKVIQDMTV